MTTSKVENISSNVCEDCRATIPEGIDTCKNIFEEVLVREYSDYRYARNHRLMVDAYSLQHPGAYMRSGKSFAAHLTGICSALEYDDSSAINQAVQKWLNGAKLIEKPASLPEHRGEVKITYVYHAIGADEHNQRVQEWARSVWAAWSEYHSLAQGWIREATSAEQ